MNKKKLAQNAKAITKAGGKYALKGIKYAGIGVLGATDLAARGVNKVASSRKGRTLASKAALIAACVAFPSVAATFATAGITMTAVNYMFNNCILGKEQSAVDAALGVKHASDKVLENALSIVSVPTKFISKEISKAAKKGETALENSL